MKMEISHKKAVGFTLIEVIIAMTLLSLILILLFSTIFTANRNWQSTERKIAQNEELRLVGGFIQRQISQNIPLIWNDKNKQRLIFTGKNDELRFTSTLPAHRGGGGVKLISLKVNRINNSRNLDLYYRQIDPDNSPFENSDTDKKVTLLENINGIELSYYGSEDSDETPMWRDEWENDDLLPLLISLKIHSIGNSHNWPEIKIPLHSDPIKGQRQFILQKRI